MSEVVVLPSGWTESNLNEVTVAIGGGTPSKADAMFWTNGTIPWISPKDMKSFLVTSSEDRLTFFALNRLTLIPKNSVLVVVRSGILSRTLPVAVNEIPVTVNQDMRAFVPEKGINVRFVAWQIVAKERDVLSACSKDGTTVASIEGQALARFPFLIAPAAEQTRIVEKLEELLSDLDAGVAELEAAQKKLAQFRQSLLKAAVEGALTAEWRAKNPPAETGAQLLERILAERRARWEAKQLAKFAEQGKTPPKDWQKKYPEPVRPDTRDLPKLPWGWVWASIDQLSLFVRNGVSKTPNAHDKGFPILRINAVRPMSVRFEECKHIELAGAEAADYFIDDGDLLATRYNGSVDLLGVVALVRRAPNMLLHPDKLIRMKPVITGSLGAWMELAANTGVSRAHIISRVKTTAGQTGISGNDLKKMPIPVPPLDEQTAAALLVENGLSAVRQQVAAIDVSLKQSAAQRQNILRAAFSGQLVPQDPDDEPASALLERIRAEKAAQATVKKARGRKARETACRSH